MCRKSSVLAVGNVKGEIMYFELKENKPHGTKDDPFSTYHIKNEGRLFPVSYTHLTLPTILLV